MTSNKFFVGDKVKLKSHIKSVFPWITDWRNKELTISEIISDKTARVYENEWLYDLSRFELINNSHRFRPGESVRVREDIFEGDKGKNFMFISDMNKMKGGIYTIKKQLSDNCYHLYEGDFGWGWEEKWLEPVSMLEEKLFEI